MSETTSPTVLKVGDAAAHLGVAAHVLRHWEDVGLLRPARLASGHRAYDDQALAHARMIQICQRAGLSLAEIRSLAVADRGRRVDAITAKRAEIAEHAAALERADRFLAHVVTCVHPIVSECEECTALVSPER